MFGALVRPFDLTVCSGHEARATIARHSLVRFYFFLSFSISQEKYLAHGKMERRDVGKKGCEIGEEETVEDERPKRKSRRRQKMHRMHFWAIASRLLVLILFSFYFLSMHAHFVAQTKCLYVSLQLHCSQ